MFANMKVLINAYSTAWLEYVPIHNNKFIFRVSATDSLKEPWMFMPPKTLFVCIKDNIIFICKSSRENHKTKPQSITNFLLLCHYILKIFFLYKNQTNVFFSV